MNQDSENIDWIVEKGIYDEKKDKNFDSRRWAYKRTSFFDIRYRDRCKDETTIMVDKMSCIIKSKEGKSREDIPYINNRITVIWYIDKEAKKIIFKHALFDDYDADKDQLMIIKNNPLLKIMQAITNDKKSDKFVVKYSTFVEKLEKIKMKVKIYGYDENDFEILEYEEN